MRDLGLDDDPSGSVGPAPAGAVGLVGVDEMGRVSDLHWKQSGSTPVTLARVEYGYDDEGNRESALRTPMPTGSPSSGTEETQENGYDVFNRLVSCIVEHDDGSSTDLIRGDEWELDLLGNWMARVMSAQGVSDVTVEHEVTDTNEIESVTTTVGAGSPSEVDFRYDLAGNLLFDGEFCYQYDAWNRVIQVNDTHDAGMARFRKRKWKLVRVEAKRWQAGPTLRPITPRSAHAPASAPDRSRPSDHGCGLTPVRAGRT